MNELSRASARPYFSCRSCRLAPVILALAVAGFTPAGCSKQAPGDETSETAQIELAVSEVPANLGCVSITIATENTEHRRFPVVPGQKASFLLSRLTPGVVVLSVDAYPEACPNLGTTPTATWAGGPVSVTLRPGKNGTVVIVISPTSQTTVVLGFDPGGEARCAMGGAACAAHGDCCSQRCTFDGAQPGAPGMCAADEPASPQGPAPRYRPDALEACKGARVRYPAFDGDNFFVALPREADSGEGGSDRSAGAVRSRYVDPILTAIGFTPPGRTGGVLTPGDAPQSLPRGNFSGLLTSACARGPKDSDRDRLCGYLGELPQQPPAAGNPVATFLERTLGTTPQQLRANIETPLNYWFFSQRERGVPIEHKGAIAIQHGAGRRVATVFGSVLSNYRIVNQVAVNPNGAMLRAQRTFTRLLSVAAGELGQRARSATLVLLPYGSVPRDQMVPDPNGVLPPVQTALRFAWRTVVSGRRTVPGKAAPEPVSHLVWIDAATGDLLKQITETSEASVSTASFSPWSRDPSESDGQYVVNLALEETVPASTPASYSLSAQPWFKLTSNAVGFYGHDSASILVSNARASREVCSLFSEHRALNAFANLEEARKTLEGGGKFLPFATDVGIDERGDTNAANFGTLKLSFVKGATGDPALGINCTTAPGRRLSGAQDATIVAHEYGHLVTMQLQTGNPPNNCGAADCPILNPYNRRFFHDYSDGFAALLTESPCIGGWSAVNLAPPMTAQQLALVGNNPQPRDRVAHACASADESSQLPRLLFADDNPGPTFASALFPQSSPPPGLQKDTFPDHRKIYPGEYGDGQIIGAALWHLWQGVNSQARLPGTLSVWGHLNEAIWSTGFSNTVCPFSETSCDMNVYRAGQELLVHLTDAWINSSNSQSLNKLLASFARAGLFLTPPTCLVNDTTSPLDPLFCPDGKNGADAIVDIDDGQLDSVDFSERFGIRLADDDFVPATGPAPFLRVWTGAPFAFNSMGGNNPGDGVADPTKPLCNDTFLVEYRVFPDSSESDWKPALSGSVDATCHVRKQMDPTAWDALQKAGGFFTKVQYRVTTWRSTGPRNQRSSLKPGNGQWSFTDDLEPSAFFITEDGTLPF